MTLSVLTARLTACMESSNGAGLAPYVLLAQSDDSEVGP